jgi:hypothetical protein
MTPLLLALTLLLRNEQILTAPTTGLGGDNYGAAVAASSTNTLAAWIMRPPQSPRIPGRIAVMPFHDNAAEAPAEIVLDDTFAAPGVASNGDDYLLAWTVDGAITARRLAKNGTPLGDAETLTPSLSDGHIPAAGTTRVVWNGAHYVVVATAAVTHTVVEKSVVAAIAGTGRTMHVAEAEDVQDAAAVPGLTLALSTKGVALNGRFLDDGGSVSAPFVITNDSVLAAGLAGDGVSSFLAAWLTDRLEIKAARISLGGIVAPARSIGTTDWAGAKPAVAWSGREFTLSWPSHELTTVATENGASYTAAFAMHDATLSMTGGSGASVVTITAGGTVTSRIVRGDASAAAVDLSLVTLDQWAPRLAGDALYYLEGAGNRTPHLIRQTAAGREVVAEARAYDAAPNAVAWADSYPVRAGFVQFVPRAGNTFSADKVAIASNGSTTLVVYSDFEVWAKRFDAAGTLLETVQLAPFDDVVPTNLHAVWRGDDYLIEWQEGQRVNSVLYGRRRPVAAFTMTAGAVAYNVATSNGKTVLAWSDEAGLHLGRIDPEAPDAGPVIVPGSIRSAAVFATPSGFEAGWLTPFDNVPALGDIAWANPHLILYSKGRVIVQRTVDRTRRRVAV